MHSRTMALKQSHDFNFGGGSPAKESPGPDKFPTRQKPPAGGKLSKTLTADQKDKVYSLESENFDLKQKENYLDDKIVLMRTKLRRIEELLSKRNKKQMQDELKTGGLPSEVGDTFEAEIRDMARENTHLRDQNKKLRAIERHESAKNVSTKKPANKYNHVKGKLPNHKMKQSEQDYQSLIDEMKSKIVKGEQEIIRLTARRDELRRTHKGKGSGKGK